MLFCYMTKLAVYVMLMKPDDVCSQRKGVPAKTYHLQRMHFTSISRGLHSKEGKYYFFNTQFMIVLETVNEVVHSHCILPLFNNSFFVSRYVWGQSLTKWQDLPQFTEWGWVQRNGKVSPNWMTIPDASKACQQLIKCGCKIQKCSTKMDWVHVFFGYKVLNI